MPYLNPGAGAGTGATIHTNRQRTIFTLQRGLQGAASSPGTWDNSVRFVGRSRGHARIRPQLFAGFLASSGPWVLALPMVTEVNTALLFGKAKALVVPTVSVTNTALGFGKLKTLLMPVVSATNTALALGRLKSRLLGVVTETDTVLAIIRKSTAVAVRRARTIVLNQFGKY